MVKYQAKAKKFRYPQAFRDWILGSSLRDLGEKYEVNYSTFSRAFNNFLPHYNQYRYNIFRATYFSTLDKPREHLVFMQWYEKLSLAQIIDLITSDSKSYNKSSSELLGLRCDIRTWV